MNTTLKPATNLILCGVWIVLIVLSLAAHARLEIGIASGALGVIAGFLQARALRANADRFRESGSMWSVRKVYDFWKIRGQENSGTEENSGTDGTFTN